MCASAGLEENFCKIADVKGFHIVLLETVYKTAKDWAVSGFSSIAYQSVHFGRRYLTRLQVLDSD